MSISRIQAVARRHAVLEVVRAALVFVSLIPIAWVEFEDLAWPDRRFRVLAAVDLVFVVLLWGDLLLRAARAPNQRAFWRKSWWEPLGLVPLYAESFAWLRITRFAKLARLLRLIRALTKTRPRWLMFLDHLFNRNKLGHVAAIATAVVFALATVVWVIERESNQRLSNFGDSLWWAIVTATTVGYGDITPESGLGRLCATLLMLIGIGLIGVVSSGLAAAMIATGGETTNGPEPGRSLVDDLERLTALFDRGALREEEFTAAKRRLLGP